MAIAFARISYHTRSKGHSAVAGAAYRAGTELFDERTGEVHNFENRHDVAYTNIMLPEGADQKFKDRQTLWNAVEAAENRKNSQVAKDVVLALPRDLDLSHHIELAHQFAHYHFVQHGLVTDIAIHDHGDGNPHAHLYVTTRRLTKNGEFEKKKARDLEPDVAKGRVVNPQFWGNQWRDMQNAYFQKHNIDIEVDANHILSQRHEGRLRNEKEEHYLKEENKLRRESSIDIALNEPDSVLNLLGQKHSVFSERDIALLINKNTQTAKEFQVATAKLKAHVDLIPLGPGDDGYARYTTRANFEREFKMEDRAYDLSQIKQHRVSSHKAKSAATYFNLNQEQTQALLHLANSGDISAMVGRAGTGKSYMMKAAKSMWDDAGYTVRGTAVSGIAAKGLEADSGIPSSTIHSIKYQIESGDLQFGEKDILVMDEAGMTDLHDMARIIDHVSAAKAKLVLVGDHAQLQPVGPGAPFRAIVERVGFAELSHIQRQKNAADREASVCLSRGDISSALDHYHANKQLHFIESKTKSDQNSTNEEVESTDDVVSALISTWENNLIHENLDKKIILAHRNEDVVKLNQQARHVLKAKGLVDEKDTTFNTKSGDIKLSVGERILFLQNNRKLGVSNGEFAEVKAIENGTITVDLGKDEKRSITFSSNKYNSLTHGYAATVHKSQGTTFDDAYMYVGGYSWDRFLSYVAMTRHRDNLHIYADKNQFSDIDQLKESLSREPVKDSVLDFPVAYSVRRGFDPNTIAGRFIDTVAGVKEKIRDKWLFVSSYAAFKATKSYRENIQPKQRLREMARDVALFADLKQDMAAQAQQIIADLSPVDKFYDHHDYPQYYEKGLLRDRLATRLYQDYDSYKRALDLNRVTQSKLEKMVARHGLNNDIVNYVNHYKAHRVSPRAKVAAKIEANLKAYYPHLTYWVEKNNIDRSSLIKSIKKDALHYRRIEVLKNLTPQEKSDFCVVDRYVESIQQVKTSIAKAYQLGGFDKLSNEDVAILRQQKSRADEYAHTITENSGAYKAGVHFYEINTKNLVDGYERHLRRKTVESYKNSRSVDDRDQLCEELLFDKRYIPFIIEHDLNWKALYQGKDRFQHRQRLNRLKGDDRNAYLLVHRYQKVRIQVAKDWSKFFEDKKKSDNNKLNHTLWKRAVVRTKVRDRLAHDIVANAKQTMPHVSNTQIKLPDLEKHTQRYNKIIEASKKHQSISPNKAANKSKLVARKPSNRLDYQEINSALINQGEEFYQRVLGDDFKRHGEKIRFGSKGSMVVNLAGEKLGLWYSHESGEGGGPVQLLMNTTHGWGLSYKDALKEAVKMSGLNYTNSKMITKPPKEVKRALVITNDKKKKIASARYYYRSAKPIVGTLGEKYLRETRGITGDISAFRFHPRIRDMRTDEKGQKIVSYHPGLVVAARNQNGDIMASQTILLDAKTNNKADKNRVGVVKRTRGHLLGSAVQIHTGGSNDVIIAEGPETAASLISAKPNANIYITLGNIKNATSLSWLSDKHNTKTFLFAADQDGENALSDKSIKKAAQQLFDEKGIQCLIAKPQLESAKKYDFNDVLKIKGVDSVKEQLQQTRKLAVSRPEKRQVIEPDAAHDLINRYLDEWARLRTINSSVIKNLYGSCAKIHKEMSLSRKMIYEKEFDQQIGQLLSNEKLLTKARSQAPNLTNQFERHLNQYKNIKIDWFSDEIKNEVSKLKDEKDPILQRMCSFHDKMLSSKDPHRTQGLQKELESLAMNIFQYDKKQEKLKQISPSLYTKLRQVCRSRAIERNKSRDR